RIAPGDRIVACRSGARLHQSADDREPRIGRNVQPRHQPPHGLGTHNQLGVDAFVTHRVAAPREIVELRRRVGEVQDAALREHDVVVEVVGQPLPQLHRMLVEARVLRQQIVRAHDGGVAADIAGAEPPLFENGDIGQAVLLGKVIGGRKPVATSADDHHVVDRLRLGLAPRGLPVAIAGKAVLEKREDGIFSHGPSRVCKPQVLPSYRPVHLPKANIPPSAFAPPTPLPLGMLAAAAVLAYQCRRDSFAGTPSRMNLPSSLSRLIAMLALLAAMMGFAQSVHAQNEPAQTQTGQSVSPALAVGPGVVAEQREKLDRYSVAADRFETQMQANAQNDSALVDVRGGLEELSRELIASGVAFRPRLNTINARLDEIGPPRGEGEPPEPPDLSLERQTLIDEKAEINALIGKAETLSLRVNGMIEQINQTRRDLFTNELSRRYDISSALSGEVLGDLAAESSRLSATVS